MVKSSIKKLASPWMLSTFKGASSLLNVEVKHVDVSDTQNAGSTGLLTLLSGIAQGDTNTTRDGNSVKLMGGRFTTVLTINASASTTYVRSIIFADTRNQAANPTIADVLDTATPIGLPNLDTAPNRFLILYDRMDKMSINGDRTILYDWDLSKLANLHLSFGGTGATVASVQGLAIYSFIFSNESVNTPSHRSESRLFFVDN